MTIAAELLGFIDSAPSPYHAVDVVASRLRAAGFADVSRTDGSSTAIGAPGGGYWRRGGAIIAWFVPDVGPDAAVRIIGAHTDSPNLRIKPRPDLAGYGMRRLAAEPYGGVLLNSWLDRDLGLSGRVAVRGTDGVVSEHLFRDDRPLVRVPQLAIHLDREINDKGLLLNRQQHLNPVWGIGTTYDGEFLDWITEAAAVGDAEVLAWDAMCHDTLPSGFLGPDEDLISAARIDNLCSCFGALHALLAAAEDEAAGHISLIALFDHEEIGSETATGAAAPLLTNVLERLSAARGATAEERARALVGSRILSADMAHGTHPNYPERHEPNHPIALGGGPVIKVNVNGRYATEALTSGEFQAACRVAAVPVQVYSHRADLACGSTIGPISAARTAIPTVDVGMAQLSMHSIRELMATSDVAHMVDSFGAWLSAAR